MCLHVKQDVKIPSVSGNHSPQWPFFYAAGSQLGDAANDDVRSAKTSCGRVACLSVIEEEVAWHHLTKNGHLTPQMVARVMFDFFRHYGLKTNTQQHSDTGCLGRTRLTAQTLFLHIMSWPTELYLLHDIITRQVTWCWSHTGRRVTRNFAQQEEDRTRKQKLLLRDHWIQCRGTWADVKRQARVQTDKEEEAAGNTWGVKLKLSNHRHPGRHWRGCTVSWRGTCWTGDGT